MSDWKALNGGVPQGMKLGVILSSVMTNRGFARQPCCMAGTMKMFCIRNKIFPIGKRIYCSCHATWLPCKTSIDYCRTGSYTSSTWMILLLFLGFTHVINSHVAQRKQKKTLT